MLRSVDTLSEFLAKRYVKSLRDRPVLTILASVLILGVGAFGIYMDESRRKAEEQRRRELLATYSLQLEQLDDVQQSLKDLSEFVSMQRVRLQESEQLVSKLQEEKQRIEPLVQADRKVVDAVFQLQEQRTAASVARERWIGFGLGVGASLLASFIYAVVAFAYQKRRRSDTRNETPNEAAPADG